MIHLAKGDDLLTRAKVGMVVPFGQAGAGVAGGARGAEIVALKSALQDVRDYMRNKAAYDRAGYRDLPLSKADLEALIPVVQGKMPVIADVHRASDIRAVLKLAREEGFKVILSGAEEGWLVAARHRQGRRPRPAQPAERPAGKLRDAGRHHGERHAPPGRRRHRSRSSPTAAPTARGRPATTPATPSPTACPMRPRWRR